MRTRTYVVALFLILLPALSWGQAASMKIGGVTPAGAVEPIPMRDADSGGGEDYLPAIQLAYPAAGGAQIVDIANPLPMSDAAAAGLLASIDAYLALLDAHIPQLLLGTQAPAASLSVTQDSTGGWDMDTELDAEDYDTGAGTDTQAISGLIVPGAGGHLTVAGKTLGIASDLAGEVALVVASATFGRKSTTGTTIPVNVARMASSVDNLDSQDALVVAAGIFARIDAATLAPVAMRHGTTNSAMSVVQAQPNGPSINSALIVGNQVNGISVAANTDRANLLVQSSGTTACLVAIGAATGGTLGAVLKGGTADNDGTGGQLTTESVEAIYIWDLSGAGTCKYRYVEEVW